MIKLIVIFVCCIAIFLFILIYDEKKEDKKEIGPLCILHSGDTIKITNGPDSVILTKGSVSDIVTKKDIDNKYFIMFRFVDGSIPKIIRCTGNSLEEVSSTLEKEVL